MLAPLMMRVRVPLGVVAAVLVAGVAGAADYLGPESCKACHPEAYTTWQSSKHARAMDVLTAAQQKDARCLSCHGPNVADQHVAAVSCETCHGGGQYYAPSYVMKDAELVRLVGLVDPSEKSCRACHDASSPSLKAFNFTEALKRMDHWSAEKARRTGTSVPRAER